MFSWLQIALIKISQWLGEIIARVVEVHRFQPLRDRIKIFRESVVFADGFTVGFPPLAVRDFGVLDGLVISSFLLDRNGEPLQTVWCFCFVAVSLVPAGESHVGVKNEFVDGGNQVDVSLPRNVV
jgi:hypothetical protein